MRNSSDAASGTAGEVRSGDPAALTFLVAVAITNRPLCPSERRCRPESEKSWAHWTQWSLYRNPLPDSQFRRDDVENSSCFLSLTEVVDGRRYPSVESIAHGWEASRAQR